MKKIQQLSLFLSVFFLTLNSCQKADSPLETNTIISSIKDDGVTRTSEDGIRTASDDFPIVPSATFVLSEGNMTHENGFVSLITLDTVITDSAYYKTNFEPLGNVVQDMCIAADDRIYFISQNGSKFGGHTLVITQKRSLKLEIHYDDELKDLDWPTHVAVTDPQHVYIRDNNGVSLFNIKPTNKTLQLITGTQGAAKNQMVAINNRVFAIADNKILVIEYNTVVKTIDMGAPISGLVKSGDNNLWVSVMSSPNRIAKVNAISGQEIDSKNVTVGGVSNGVGATPGIGAYQNLIYFNNFGLKVYRMDFTTGVCTEVANCKDVSANANIAYNNVSVDPRNGDVYMHTIKGYGWDFLKNDIICWKSTGNGLELKHVWPNHTHFPTGCYFTEWK